MEVYPLNIVLAVVTASVTVFLGFLPTKTLRSSFFAHQTVRLIFAWAAVGFICPTPIMHYPFFFAFLCFAAWWKFSRDNALSGKMWLSVASGLGISVGVILILNVTPGAYPHYLAPAPRALLLGSIYLGGASIGLAWFACTLAQNISTNSGVTNNLVRRYTSLLFILTAARVGVLVVELCLPCGLERTWVANPQAFGLPASTSTQLLTLFPGMLALPMLGLLVLAFFAHHATRLSSRVLPVRPLIAFCILGFATEIIARLLVL